MVSTQLLLPKTAYALNEVSEDASLNKGSCFAQTLGVTKFKNVTYLVLITVYSTSIIIYMKLKITYEIKQTF